MDGRFDVTRAGSRCGVAELSQNGLMQDLSFNGTAPDNENVYRLAAVCGGRYSLLGVPVPDKNGTLTLKKSFSKSSLRELGFDSPDAFELVLPDENYDGENSSNKPDDNEANTPEKPESKPENKPENIPENKSENESEGKPENIPENRPEPEFEENIVKNKPTAEPEKQNPPLQKKNNMQQPNNMQRRQNIVEPSVQRHNMLNQNPWIRGPQRSNQQQANTNRLISPEKQNTPEKPKPSEKQNAPEKPNLPESPNPSAAKTNGWKPVVNPSVLFAENGALSSADDINGALVSEEDEFVYLAIPISDGEPFPLMSAFCLGEPQTINGEDYLVFKLKNGAFTA